MNDNLIKRSTHDEIIAVLGHEMGHYVLSHVAIGITWNGLLFLVAFAFLQPHIHANCVSWPERRVVFAEL